MKFLYAIACYMIVSCGADDHAHINSEPESCDDIPHYSLTGQQLTCAEIKLLIGD